MLRSFSEIEQSRVEWLWFPYIPYGKITVLQGNPGGGKSHVGIQLAADLSSQGYLPGGIRLPSPQHVIYQCAEDGLADTIKPRLVAAGANCENVAFLDDDMLTLDDEKIRDAIADFHARLLVIDPLQAYLGTSDISSASSIRRMMNRLCKWANFYNCAVLIIGHLNKKEGANDLYRGLGSIDVTASARSVLQLEADAFSPGIRIIRHVKSSLAARGEDVRFSINPNHGIVWLKDENSGSSVSNVPDTKPKEEVATRKEKKQTIAAGMLRELLSDGPMLSSDIEEFFKGSEVGFKTVQLVKNNLKILSFRKDGKWYWGAPASWGDSV